MREFISTDVDKMRDKDSGDAIFAMIMILSPVIILIFSFSIAVSTWIGNKDNVNAIAQASANSAIKEIDKRGSLNESSARRFASEYYRLIKKDVFSIGHDVCKTVGGRRADGIEGDFGKNDSILANKVSYKTNNNSVSVELQAPKIGALFDKGDLVAGPFVYVPDNKGNPVSLIGQPLTKRESRIVYGKLNAEVVTALPNPFNFFPGVLPDCLNFKASVSSLVRNSENDGEINIGTGWDGSLISESPPVDELLTFSNCLPDGKGTSRKKIFKAPENWRYEIVKNKTGAGGWETIASVDSQGNLVIEVPKKAVAESGNYPKNKFRSKVLYSLQSDKDAQTGAIGATDRKQQLSSEVRSLEINYCPPVVDAPDPIDKVFVCLSSASEANTKFAVEIGASQKNGKLQRVNGKIIKPNVPNWIPSNLASGFLGSTAESDLSINYDGGGRIYAFRKPSSLSPSPKAYRLTMSFSGGTGKVALVYGIEQDFRNLKLLSEVRNGIDYSDFSSCANKIPLSNPGVIESGVAKGFSTPTPPKPGGQENPGGTKPPKPKVVDSSEEFSLGITRPGDPKYFFIPIPKGGEVVSINGVRDFSLGVTKNIFNGGSSAFIQAKVLREEVEGGKLLLNHYYNTSDPVTIVITRADSGRHTITLYPRGFSNKISGESEESMLNFGHQDLIRDMKSDPNFDYDDWYCYKYYDGDC